MAEQIISPGVFTRENDLSFLPQGIGSIGAAIVGPTVQGPAFVPTVVKSFAEYERIFGPLSSETFVPQTVREYLRSAGSVTVTRVLGGGGYTYTKSTNEILGLAVFPSGSTTGLLLGAIYPSKDVDALPDLQESILTNATDPTDIPYAGLGGISGSSYIASGSTDGTLQLFFSSSTTSYPTTFDASINPSSNKYWVKLLGETPDNSKTGVVAYDGIPGYAELNFKTLTTSLIANSDGLNNHGITHPNDVSAQLASGSVIQLLTQGATLTYSGLTGASEGYSYASTPFIQSGKAKGSHNLFKFHTISHGKELNNKYKVSIANLREPADIDGVEQYSLFSVILRRYNDIDKTPSILEQYNNVSLDPDSPNYISRVIGDRFPEYNSTLDKVELLGNYPNVSNYIRVEVDTAVDAKATSPKLSPKGFAVIVNPINTSTVFSGSIVNQNSNEFTVVFPSASYEGVQRVGAITSTDFNSRGYLGWMFEDKEFDNKNFLKPLPAIEENNVAGAFNVEDYNVHPSASITFKGSLSAELDATGTSGPTANELKFTVPFQGGSDGIASHVPIFTGNESTLASTYSTGDNLYGFNLKNSTKAGSKAYKKALNILSNQDEYDINMLALPGVIKQLHSNVTTAAIDMVETRGDAFYIMDLAAYNESVNTAVSNARGLDTNYAAVYYPWVKVLDTSMNKPVLVPPSVIVPGAIAASDNIAAEWFAPAGLNRGVLGNVIEAKIRLNQAERDKLYDAKINPIATFPATGVCIWGQKTLQERSTALDRINVRRLLIALKKFIGSSSKFLVFEQNTQATRNRFLNIVNPYLESVQQRQGLFAFRVQMDETNNTPTEVDRNQLVGAIFLQPTKTAEFIVLDFNVLPTGATFDS
jgi:hypothetical protein